MQLMFVIQIEGQTNAVLFPCFYTIAHKNNFIFVFMIFYDSETGSTGS